MKIGEFSKRIGISEYTLRYYEKVGVLEPIKRNRNGYREYLEEDIAWMEFVGRLKDTGMKIEDITAFAVLRAKGDSSKKDRLKMLIDHEKRIKEDLERLSGNLRSIQEKIAVYRR